MTESVLAIGNFDGVHRGHQAIMAAARSAAEGRPVVAVTFWPHPVAVLRPAEAPPLLTDLSDRIELLKWAGADQVRVVEFTPQVSAWSPRQFVEAVLTPLDPKVVVVGQNFRFGHQAAADGSGLADLSRGRFDVVVLPTLSNSGPLSSSRVRQALAEGDPVAAAAVLGRWFRYSGIVVQGDQRGRQLGFPTANLTVPTGFACPADGVYAGWLTTPDRRRRPAAVSVGVNPTFDGIQRRVEAHVVTESDLDLYGLRVEVDFVTRLRGQVRFTGQDRLIEQLGRDVAATGPALAAAGQPWA
ncbi:MAG: riboflavin biosynthesis protein RibF [Propionibacteriaceae bacterium]|jgi:riboflavin kinase/FMN adenylyltransferase|nr:riboflavin biosynthesis protein RibF [Propionibacteriaceae bacterium]